jgi:hypothetical protein
MSNPTLCGRSAKELSQSLDHRLKIYAIAAGAVGAGFLASAQPAEAEIVYTQAHYELPISPDFQFVDLNGDGVPDVAFLHYTYGLSNSFNNTIKVDARKNGVVAIDVRYADPLPKGAIIGTSANFEGGIRSMARSHVIGYSRHRYTAGPWGDVANRYVGVSFEIGGETHYGWIRMTVIDHKSPLRVLITGYAYETIANKSLRAGQTSADAVDAGTARSTPPAAIREASLGSLAAGAYGLYLRRREDRRPA